VHDDLATLWVLLMAILVVLCVIMGLLGAILTELKRQSPR
jgi:hypothetical protein